jgi:hypothetical protein
MVLSVDVRKLGDVDGRCAARLSTNAIRIVYRFPFVLMMVRRQSRQLPQSGILELRAVSCNSVAAPRSQAQFSRAINGIFSIDDLAKLENSPFNWTLRNGR